ncbi:diguanylate cyclase [Clostridia bacterium OttesenSCG-928-O13]|nr:diguanylate cyclase [Clostridia bacterium OttesenSCG-928-O13]
MNNKLRKTLGFPYPSEYEAGYNQDLMISMHKPLLIALAATLLFVTWLVGICVFWPDSIAPPQYIKGLLAIHFVFLVFTALALLMAVGLRRQLFQYPKFHVIFCNVYAIGTCLWASVLSAYAHYSPSVYTAFIFVMLCVSMVSLFKPWLAMMAFFANYLVYFFLARHFLPQMERNHISQLFSAALAAVLGMVISIAFYRFRTRNYYDKQIIAQQLEEIHQMNHQLQMLIHIDNLTGLYNRRFYAESLPEKLAQTAQDSSFCCMMFDVDFFKAYNDCYGHPAGDECLRRVAGIIRESLPPQGAYAVRYGGEEFFVLAKASSPQDATALTDLIFRAVAQAYIPHTVSSFGVVTLSCGVVFCRRGDARTLAQLTQKADEALYHSKQNGRNQTTLYQ